MVRARTPNLPSLWWMSTLSAVDGLTHFLSNAPTVPNGATRLLAHPAAGGAWLAGGVSVPVPEWAGLAARDCVTRLVRQSACVAEGPGQRGQNRRLRLQCLTSSTSSVSFVSASPIQLSGTVVPAGQVAFNTPAE
jgi:hypothetical protein